MGDQPIELSCRYCQRKKPFKLQSIVQHALKHSKCSKLYSDIQIDNLRRQVKEVNDEKKKIKNAENYEKNKSKIKEQRAKNYKANKAKFGSTYQRQKIENPDRFEKKRQDRIKHYDKIARSKYHKANYNKVERAKRYQASKFDIAFKYQKRKDERAKKYDKIERAKKYRREMEVIKQKREELKRNKESQAGQYFEKKIVGPTIEEVYDKMFDDHFDIACLTVMDDDNHSNQAVEAVFESELWLNDIAVTDCEEANALNWRKETHSCEYWTEKDGKPCVHHMSESQQAEAIGKSNF